MRRFVSTRILLVAAVYLLLGAAIYSNVATKGVFGGDDSDYIVNNEATKSLAYALSNFSEPRYLGYVTFALNYAVSGASPVPFHQTNILIHVLSSLAAFLLCSLIMRTASGSEEERQPPALDVIPFLVGLFFLIHPIQTQAVSYITQRFASLTGLLYLSSCACYIHFRNGQERRTGPTGMRNYAASLVFALLATKTKEIAFTIPFVLLLTELTLLRHSKLKSRRFGFLLPFAAVAALIPLSLFAENLGLASPDSNVLSSLKQAKQDDLLNLSPSRYFMNQLPILVRYISLFFWPVGQRVQYDIAAIGNPIDPRIVLSAIALLSLAATGVFIYKQSRSADDQIRPLLVLGYFGIAWFFLTSSIESSFIPIKHLAFEQRMYLPSFGFFSFAVAIPGILVRRAESRSVNRVAAVFVAAATLALCTATYTRNRIWTDVVLLWTDVVERSPGLLTGWHNRAVAYRERKEYRLALADMDRAAEHIQRSFQNRTPWLDPDLNAENAAKVFGLRGVTAFSLGDREKARADFFRLVAFVKLARNKMISIQAMAAIADAFYKAGMYEDSYYQYSKLVELVSLDGQIVYRRGVSALYTGHYDQCISDLTHYIDSFPDHPAPYFYRALALEKALDGEAARRDLVRSCSLRFPLACKKIGKPVPAATRPAVQG